ncbi:hypothetical protein D3C87_1912660 [compost metagenome]
MHATVLKILHQIVQALAFRNEIDWPQQFLPVKVLVQMDMGEQILDIQYSLHMIKIIPVNRHPRVA